MEAAAIRVMKWAMFTSFAVPLVAFSLLSWFEGTAGADGPGIGLGLALVCSAVLIALLITVAVTTALLGFGLWKRRARPIATERYWLLLGSTYSVVAGVVFTVVAR